MALIQVCIAIFYYFYPTHNNITITHMTTNTIITDNNYRIYGMLHHTHTYQHKNLEIQEVKALKKDKVEAHLSYTDHDSEILTKHTAIRQTHIY